jgi:hypothetical protein
MSVKRHKLTDLSIEELSLVDSPANKASRAVLMKRDTPVEAGELSLFAKIARKLGLTESLTQDPGVAPALVAALAKADDEEDDDGDEMSDDELAELEKELDELEKTTTTNEDDMLTKADLDAVMAKVDGLAATVTKKDEELAKKDETIVQLSKRLETLEAANTDRAIVAKAANIRKAAPVGTETVAVLLKQLDEEGQTALGEILAKFSEVAADSALFSAVAHVSDLSPTAQTELAKAITEIKKGDPKLTDEQAYAKAIEANPALYEELETSAADD